MNRDEKQLHAARLLDAIGGIDDAHLQEAMTWRRATNASSPVKRPFPWRAIYAVAACLVVFVGLFSLLFHFINRPVKSPDTSLSHVQRIDQLLSSCAESPSFTLSSVEKTDFFDGNVRLVLRNRETGDLYMSRPLTESEQETLLRELSTANRTPVSDGETIGWQVWVLQGNGDVRSPYLAPSAGNVGAAVLFDYEAEYIPTEAFASLLEDLDG